MSPFSIIFTQKLKLLEELHHSKLLQDPSNHQLRILIQSKNNFFFTKYSFIGQFHLSFSYSLSSTRCTLSIISDSNIFSSSIKLLFHLNTPWRLSPPLVSNISTWYHCFQQTKRDLDTYSSFFDLQAKDLSKKEFLHHYLFSYIIFRQICLFWSLTPLPQYFINLSTMPNNVSQAYLLYRFFSYLPHKTLTHKQYFS